MKSSINGFISLSQRQFTSERLTLVLLIQETNGISFPINTAPGMNEQCAQMNGEKQMHTKWRRATFVIKTRGAAGSQAILSAVSIRVARRRNNEPRVVMEDNLGML
jgi:hypothetical protein